MNAMDNRAAKLALARQKLRSHQEKKVVNTGLSDKDDSLDVTQDDAEQERQKNHDIELTDNIKKSEEKCDGKINYNNLNLNLHASEALENKETINVTEFLISNEKSLDLQIKELQTKLMHLENDYTLNVDNLRMANQKINNLETELKNLKTEHVLMCEEIVLKDRTIEELNNNKSLLIDENSNLFDQLEFAKNIVTGKEAENSLLHDQLHNIQNQFDVMQLQLQQLTNGTPVPINQNNSVNSQEQIEAQLQKISDLEEQLKHLQKDRDHINLHYEHYVRELNEQLQLVTTKNQMLLNRVEELSKRESGLIDQISEMEIRLQNYAQSHSTYNEPKTETGNTELQQKYDKVLEHVEELKRKYSLLEKQYLENEAKYNNNQRDKDSIEQDMLSMSKLNADITSDKIAAQRATEQNKKLKTDLQELEEAFIKMSKDKLELTEKLTAEKYLNRELTIKLAEVSDNAKDMHIKLMAKDQEMIRLQDNFREVENKYESLMREFECIKEVSETYQNKGMINCDDTKELDTDNTNIHKSNQNTELHEKLDERKNEFNTKEDAMIKLQSRFLKIMDEVASLSDEKHRLEHIILQLQNETDTICEYVALYQQQRSLLKKRDEERSAQIQVFQSECNKLKDQIEELSEILLRLLNDNELISYFKLESKQIDKSKIVNLLKHLKNNTLIDPYKNISELKNFYPCNCCSGTLINV